MAGRLAFVVAFAALLVAPLLLRSREPPPPPGARRLIIVTPHNEQIRAEFSRAFEAWHEREHGERVRVVYNLPGGTSEIRKMLEAQYGAALREGRRLGGQADLVFGGGTYEHGLLKHVSVDVSGERRATSISVPIDFDRAWLASTYGESDVGGAPLYDEDLHWFGTALSGFGIVYNRDVLDHLSLPEPEAWTDLCEPRLRGWVALVHPGQSGSATTAFDAIIQHRGWEQGWRLLRRAAANARYFSAASLKPPSDVSSGEAAMGVTIDFYGRFQAQAIREAGGGDRVGYVDPPGESTIDPDPISMLRGAPEPDLARRFVEFCLTDEAQALWQFHATGADPVPGALGPKEYELRRLPIVRSMYDRFAGRMIDQVNPYEIARPVERPIARVRDVLPILFAAMAIDHHEALRDAWARIVEHPAYPLPKPGERAPIISAEDIDDPELALMLERFDAMPSIEGPGGSVLDLATPAHLEEIRAGWLKSGWAHENLWPAAARPQDELRRRFGEAFRANYGEVVRLDSRRAGGNVIPP